MLSREEMKRVACARIEAHRDEIIGIAKTVLDTPETGFTEQKTARLVQQGWMPWAFPIEMAWPSQGSRGRSSVATAPGPGWPSLGSWTVCGYRTTPTPTR